jgi:phosphate-selective porin
MFRRFALLAVLAALALTALAPALASGAGKNSTKIVVSLKFPAFHGKLSSPRSACLGSRTVKMYRVQAGKKKLLGKDKSEDNGKWMVKAGKLTSGEYFATVAKRGKCKAAKSQTLTID